MKNRFLIGLALAIVAAIAAQPAWAAKKVRRDCQERITIDGPTFGNLNEEAALKSAIEAWHSSAVRRYGIYYGEWDTALDKRKPSCGRQKVQWSCTVSAVPCKG